MSAAAEVFARAVLAFEPYAQELVYVGGWVHALYLTDAGLTTRPVVTDDVDVSLPRILAPRDRPTLLELARKAGFTEHWLPDVGDALRLLYSVPNPRSGMQIVDLDLLTESPTAAGVPIQGQPDLLAQGYPGQHLLQRESQWITVGPDVHPLLDPPQRIRVPTIAAYVLQKGAAPATRTVSTKLIKDLVYVYEIVRAPALSEKTVKGMLALAPWYPTEYAVWRQQLTRTVEDEHLRRGIAEQIVTAAGTPGALGIVAERIAAQFTRLLAETGPTAPTDDEGASG